MKALNTLKSQRDDILAKLNSDELQIDQIDALVKDLNQCNSHIGILETIPEQIAMINKAAESTMNNS